MRKIVTYIVFLLLFLLVVACGNSEESSVNDDANPPTESEASDGVKTNGDNPSDIEEEIILTMADHYPSGHILMDEAQKFQERVTELTDGQVTFEYYPGGQLGSISEMARLVRDGAVDLGYTHLESATFLPLTSVTGLPSAAITATEVTNIFKEMLAGPLAEEWESNKLKPLYPFATPPNVVLLKEKAESIDDLKGLKIRTSGAIHSGIPDIFGATSVSLNVNDIYEAMQRGVIDATLMNLSNTVQYHLEEVTEHALIGANFGVNTHAYSINLDVWNSLPEPVQDALIQAGEEASQSTAQLMDDEVESALTAFDEEGIGVTELTAEESQEVIKLLAPLNEKWLEDMESQSIDGTEVLEAFKIASEKAGQD